MWLLLDQRGYWEDCGRPGTSENDKTKEENIHNKVMLAEMTFPPTCIIVILHMIV